MSNKSSPHYSLKTVVWGYKISLIFNYKENFDINNCYIVATYVILSFNIPSVYGKFRK